MDTSQILKVFKTFWYAKVDLFSFSQQRQIGIVLNELLYNVKILVWYVYEVVASHLSSQHNGAQLREV